jgi:hypothetical protein
MMARIELTDRDLQVHFREYVGKIFVAIAVSRHVVPAFGCACFDT